MKNLIESLEDDEREAVKDIARAIFAAIALHAILLNETNRGLSYEQKAHSALICANALMKGLN